MSEYEMKPGDKVAKPEGYEFFKDTVHFECGHTLEFVKTEGSRGGKRLDIIAPRDCPLCKKVDTIANTTIQAAVMQLALPEKTKLVAVLLEDVIDNNLSGGCAVDKSWRQINRYLEECIAKTEKRKQKE